MVMTVVIIVIMLMLRISTILCAFYVHCAELIKYTVFNSHNSRLHINVICDITVVKYIDTGTKIAKITVYSMLHPTEEKNSYLSTQRSLLNLSREVDKDCFGFPSIWCFPWPE